jgi:alanine racemase
MTRPTNATIHRGAFVANYRRAKALAPAARALAVIKANAYGHGAIPLAEALADEADAFGVACCEEALELRDAGIRNPIVLLEGVFEPAELALAAQHHLQITVHDDVQIDWLERAQLQYPLTVWLKLDTGMHRLGFDPGEAARLHTRLVACAQVEGVVLMSHFARADELQRDETTQQIERFSSAVAGIRAPASLANSAAVLAWPASHQDWTRPGIMLYGSSPLPPGSLDHGLSPVMHLESRLIAVRQLADGESIGYGGRFTCSSDTRVGVVAIGYADGYPRNAPDGTPVAVNGVRTRLIGRVSMDMITVDLSDLPDARVGDPVQLWGDQVSANEVAEACDTIAYELFTRVGQRVHRILR